MVGHGTFPRMAKDLEAARKELDDEYSQHRKRMGEVLRRVQDVERLGPEDDIYGALEKLEDAVKEARTGGLVGGGAKGHRKALEEWRERQGR
jgi:hypothetical protein